MQTNRKPLRELIGRAILIAVTIGTFMLLVILFDSEDKTPTAKFEVVDKYEQCDVVRYTDKTNRWHYFLHCPNQ